MMFVLLVPLLATVATTDEWIFFLAVVAVNVAVCSSVFSIYLAQAINQMMLVASTSSGGSESGGRKDFSSISRKDASAGSLRL